MSLSSTRIQNIIGMFWTDKTQEGYIAKQSVTGVITITEREDPTLGRLKNIRNPFPKNV